jgi:soluble lytic murein transglycosylase-like protein
MHVWLRLILRSAALPAVLGVAVASSLHAGDALYYKEENGSIVFTNVGGDGLRRVPGFTTRADVVAAKPLPATRHDRYIQHLSNETGVSSDLIKAVAMVESGFDANARSSKGALGLMQLMPATARQYGVRNAYDPHQNLRGGAAHLSSLLDRYDGNLTLTLAAYNAGSSAVQRYDGVPPYRETRDYIRKVRDLLDGKRSARVARQNSRPLVSDPIRVIHAADGTILAVN